MKINNKSILVVGDVFLDIFGEYNTLKISPEAPVPVIKKTKDNFFLGGAANVANNIKSIVKALKSGQIEIKNDKDGNIGASIGKKSFADTKILENYKAILETLSKEKPTGIKGDFILSAFLTSTMGVSCKLKLEK